ncbi:MAG: hypothetical protein JW991_04095 [Candidatus Pacebacteria bacterium]|nr:hypothetical protein [Candidatus Paceibacterota bacterium]
MPQISKFEINQKISKRITEVFLNSILKIKNKKEAIDFFSDLLTSTEQTMLIKRLAIAVLAGKNYSYESIMDILKVSRATISSVKNVINQSEGGYDKVIKRLLKEEKIKKFFLTIEEILEIMPPKGSDRREWGKRKRQRIIEKQAPF